MPIDWNNFKSWLTNNNYGYREDHDSGEYNVFVNEEEGTQRSLTRDQQTSLYNRFLLSDSPYFNFNKSDGGGLIIGKALQKHNKD